jgi:predicted dehydrogenase
MSFKLCVVGCGQHSTSSHGPSYARYKKENPEITLSACCDVNASAARAYQEKFGFATHYTDLDAMLRSEHPDAVALILPYHLAAPIALRIMQAGVPLLMEKPPGASCTELRDLIAAADRLKVPHMVAFNRRSMPIIRKTREWMETFSRESPASYLRYDFYRQGRRDPDFESTAIHGIDAAKYLAGSSYRQVDIFYQPMPELGPNVANVYLYAEFENGLRAQLNFCPNAGICVERATIQHLDKTIFMETPIWGGYDTPGAIKIVEASKLTHDLSGHDVTDGAELFESNGFYHENKYFLDCIRSGRRPVHTFDTALQSMELMECIRDRKAHYGAPPRP